MKTTEKVPNQPCNIVIIGASGDLTRRKLMPALFSLYCNGMLPEEFCVVGFARSKMSDEDWRTQVTERLTCRYVPGGDADCQKKMDEFLSRCHYHSGNYNSISAFSALDERITELGGKGRNSVFYMAIPPSIFIETAYSMGGAGLIHDKDSDGPWSRVVLEKPFGRDLRSSKVLQQALSSMFTEEQTFRIDHYLGKEVIQNLLILRFANLIFEPLWNRQYIEDVTITFSEEIGCEGRAGYFDQYGIIRDVMQNHLMQILALVAMEQPMKLDAQSIAEEKVRLLRSVEPLTLENLVTGQYTAADGKPGYLDDEEVPKDSITETYARGTLNITNRRWWGVPFHVISGKAMKDSCTEIVIKFKDAGYSIFNQVQGMADNRLVIRVQPNESISLEIINKVPGLELALETAKLDLLYTTAYSDTPIPDAYERLLLDVLRGDHSLFLGDAELDACWQIVTDALHALEEQDVKPKPYPFGSNGPS